MRTPMSPEINSSDDGGNSSGAPLASPTGNASVDTIEDEKGLTGESPSSFGYDLVESTLPLKGTIEEPMAEIPRPTFKSSNSLRNLTEQLSKEGKGGKLPLSPVVKRESLKSPFNSPGILGNRVPPTRVSSGGLIGGSLHRRMMRSNSPGGLGGSLHGAPRAGLMGARSQSLGGSLHGMPRSRRRSTSPIPRGSLMGGKPHALSPPPGASLNGSRHGQIRPRSKSPGPLSGGSSHGLRSRSPGPLMGTGTRSRSKSPGALAGVSRRSLRTQQRLSFQNKVPSAPVSILRKGKFSQPIREPEVSTHTGRSMHSFASLASLPDGGSPPGNSLRRSRRSLLIPKTKRVSFWFHDEPSVAPSYETEDSMQFGDLGFDSSGDVSIEGDRGYGQRSMRGEMAFIEVMDLDGAHSLHRDEEEDEYDCMVKSLMAPQFTKSWEPVLLAAWVVVLLVRFSRTIREQKMHPY
eukprot:CAMPEP_0176136114 /NCGR_PEP_ID=MMETSP0120_2-20121206/69068_1 /TAXON_ID=160619 /ORGANISM="Kryptoperidinium foliaceum, Strain CCMP 1326" /LENGTH=461 /DNA_ID=CAMNT_0017471869 /DNA_START=92 /DNA_END=1475 /DNA_ORIENTATION=-